MASEAGEDVLRSRPAPFSLLPAAPKTPVPEAPLEEGKLSKAGGGLWRFAFLPLPPRWRMLLILCINICVSYLPWYTFVPITSQGMAAFEVVSQDLNMLCIIYSLVYVPSVFLSDKLLTAVGCRRCFIFATGCLSVGCWLRCRPSLLENLPVSLAPFTWLLLGQTLCAAGQTFLVNATSHMAAEWFPPDERPAAAMISNLMNFLGGSLSFVVPTWYVSP
ncbi:unnamed protein product [Polarella glacialis]|uniref:Uncharacterized protein n=1 Tax=Polarella glacialis TaxID=89957 RepID=A0A813JP29_POLGL|nr:unnamed protein product [Polarella glacialis]